MIRYYKVNKILMHPSNIIFQASLGVLRSPQELVYLDYAEGVESKGMWKFQNCFMDDFHLFQWKSLSILEKENIYTKPHLFGVEGNYDPSFDRFGQKNWIWWCWTETPRCPVNTNEVYNIWRKLSVRIHIHLTGRSSVSAALSQNLWELVGFI